MTRDQELEELLEGIDALAEAMKERVKEKHAKGKKGWSNATHQFSQYSAKKALAQMKEGALTKDIDVAAWMAIHHTNRKRNGRISSGGGEA